MSILEFVTYLLYLNPIILVLILVYSYIKAEPTPLTKIILSYLTTCLIFDFLMHLLGEIQSNNLILIPCFGVVELVLFSLLYHTQTKHPVFICMVLPTLLCFVYELVTVDFKNTVSFQSYTRFISTLSLVCMALFYCYLLLKNSWKTYQSSFFLLNAALLIYASFTCLFYLPINLMINSSSQSKFLFWLFNLVVTLFFYLINAKVVCSPGKMKTSS